MPVSLNLGKKLIFLVMIVSVIAMTATGFLSFNHADQILKERAGDQLFGESSIRGETMRLLFESRIEQNNVLASDPMIRILVDELNRAGAGLDAGREERRRDFLIQVQAFEELIGFSIGIEDVKVVGAAGDVLFSLVKTGDLSLAGDPLFERGLGGAFIDFEPSGGGKRMVAVSPVFAGDKQRGDEPIGVVISRMRTEAIDGILLNRSGLGETGEVYMVNGDLLMLSESRFVDDAVFAMRVDTQSVRECFAGGADHRGFYRDYRGVPVYGSSYCAGDLGVALVAKIDESELDAPISILQDRIFQTGLAITLGMGAAAFAVSKSLSRPLIKLKSAANRIAGGDFGVRTGIRTGDEIGELSSAFDSMAERLQGSLIEIKEKEDVIRQQEDILLQFSERSERYCVGMVDIMDSTRICAGLSDAQTGGFYRIFLNSMDATVKGHGGTVVKNIGDALLFYFDASVGDAPARCLGCCTAMLEDRGRINAQLAAEGLPRLDYRISATYGIVRIARTSMSSVNDIFGATVNRCAKINRSAPPNGLIIDEELRGAAGDPAGFAFERAEGGDHGYAGYVVRRSSPARGPAAPPSRAAVHHGAPVRASRSSRT